MTTISELIGRTITPETKHRKKAKMAVLSAPIKARGDKPPAEFEAKVFNFLLKHKDSLGIKSVIKFTNLLVDGAIELTDGRRLTLEMKYRMNWMKACQAEWQFRNYLKLTEAKANPVSGGLVFFEKFDGDGWQRRVARRLLQNGWNGWYRSHSEVDGLRVNLLRLCGKTLEGFSLADTIMAKIKEMTGEEVDLLLKRVAAERR